jgi:hypothetical protein
MTFADQVRQHQRRCQPHMLRLRALAAGDPSAALASQVFTEVRNATNVVIAEAVTALAATADGRSAASETFLWVRLARLARAADEAVDAARITDASGLRDHLALFDALAAAIWTVPQDFNACNARAGVVH